jgi:1D-myo-inositol-tetrakisphosphate 5-kinase/inositol-polyphosphate multikinase
MADAAHVHSLVSQVGGHKGVMASDDDSLIMKPALPLEIAFYQTLNSESSFASLRPFVPHFFGILRLEGELIKPDGDISQDNIRPVNDKSDKCDGLPEPKYHGLRCLIQSIVLENLAHPFLRPNILDAKLGTVLYDDVDASPEKRKRMIETARKTTSFETGLRLTGFQVSSILQAGPSSLNG